MMYRYRCDISLRRDMTHITDRLTGESSSVYDKDEHTRFSHVKKSPDDC